MVDIENREYLASYDFVDQFEESLSMLRTEVFKLKLLSSFLCDFPGLPNQLNDFLGTLFQTRDYLEQCTDEFVVLFENLKVGDLIHTKNFDWSA